MIQFDDNRIRMDVLQRLAEQAMSDSEFRTEASDDLPSALEKHGYDLTPEEMALVLRFRRSLADAGIDLDVVSGMGEDQLSSLLERIQRQARRSGQFQDS